MPHCILEVSEQVHCQYKNFFSELHHGLCENLSTPIANCKSRMVTLKDFYLGDGTQDVAFAHLTIKILPGRSDELLSTLAESAVALLRKYCQSDNDIKFSAVFSELNSSYTKAG